MAPRRRISGRVPDAPGRGVADMNLRFSRCTKCHKSPDTRRWLLTPDCSPEPPLRLPMRGWFPPRGWGGSTSAPHRPLIVLSTNPGHPLPEERGCLARFPDSPAEAKQVAAVAADAQLAFVSAMYQEGSRTPFHTRSVQVARSVLWLFGRAGVNVSRDWFEDVWFSDVVKCSTARETGSKGFDELALECRELLEEELRVLGPTQLLVTLGAVATQAVARLNLPVPAIRVPHPAGHDWRRIDRAEHDLWLRQACRVLGLDWEQVRDPLAEVRGQLAKHPRGPLGRVS